MQLLALTTEEDAALLAIEADGGDVESTPRRGEDDDEEMFMQDGRGGRGRGSTSPLETCPGGFAGR